MTCWRACVRLEEDDLAGAVALMWSANPSLIGDIEGTEQILVETARPSNETADTLASCGDVGRPNNMAGYGLLDVFEAVRAAVALQ